MSMQSETPILGEQHGRRMTWPVFWVSLIGGLLALLAALFVPVLMVSPKSAKATNPGTMKLVPSGLQVSTTPRKPTRSPGVEFGLSPITSRDYHVKGNGTQRTALYPYYLDGSTPRNFQAVYGRVVVTSGTVKVKVFGPAVTDTTLGQWISTNADSVANAFEYRGPLTYFTVETASGAAAAHVHGTMF